MGTGAAGRLLRIGLLLSRMRSEIMYVGILVLVKILLHFLRLSQPQRRLVTSTLPGSQVGRTLPSSARTPDEKL